MPELTISYEDSVPVTLEFVTVQAQPPTGLAVAPVVGGGTFAAGNYFWEVTATTSLGETTVSNEATTAIALNGSANLSWNAPNATVTGYKLYRGTVSGAENVLVTTIVGNLTQFTDTNVGGAGAPPGANTATVSDYVLMTGAGYYAGYALSETSGVNPYWVDIYDGPLIVGTSQELAKGTDTRTMRGDGIPLNSGIRVHVNNGAVRGVVYARIPPVNQ
jgi:hypothetical protein